ncbi:hypothetical protein E3T43_18490 [Cryobacterium sp. Hh7]|nr:hypothetical protein E3T43_18490 [Cryobacterium sp. Hh7]
MVEMEFSALSWWIFWVVVQVLVVVGVVVALGLFIRWGRRKSAILESSNPREGQGPAATGK